MSGHYSFFQLTANFDPQRQQTIQKKTEQLKASMALAELRKALQFSPYKNKI